MKLNLPEDDAIDANKKTAMEISKLGSRIDELTRENERLTKENSELRKSNNERSSKLQEIAEYSNETSRILRALLLSGHEVRLSIDDTAFGFGSMVLRVRATDTKHGTYTVQNAIALEAIDQMNGGAFQISLDHTMHQLWDGRWR